MDYRFERRELPGIVPIFGYMGTAAPGRCERDQCIPEGDIRLVGQPGEDKAHQSMARLFSVPPCSDPLWACHWQCSRPTVGISDSGARLDRKSTRLNSS